MSPSFVGSVASGLFVLLCFSVCIFAPTVFMLRVWSPRRRSLPVSWLERRPSHLDLGGR